MPAHPRVPSLPVPHRLWRIYRGIGWYACGGDAIGGMECAWRRCRWAGESLRNPRRPNPYSRTSAGRPLQCTNHSGRIPGRATLRNSPTLWASMRTLSAISIAELPVPCAFTILVSTPHHRRTIAVPGPLHVRISPRNPRMKRRWYGDGTAMVRCKWGELLGCAPTFGVAEGLVRHAAAPRYGNAVKTW